MITTEECKRLARTLYLKGATPSEVTTALVRAGANINANNQAMKIANAIYAELEAQAKAKGDD